MGRWTEDRDKTAMKNLTFDRNKSICDQQDAEFLVSRKVKVGTRRVVTWTKTRQEIKRMEHRRIFKN